ncbi:hypothetical protein [Deinococcus multiflagellatus]|uniref:Uncharacterized protein n=1 Tax=Deinococcus multiflagellatus TaxID=1656887 RepID=A0ABW1ZU50_9DEIO|nr:hypothetical protein [Deinococcus multiflagellatus]MBZ9715549.1 hypothetical protein [Deinococcus multiflagellatus]
MSALRFLTLLLRGELAVISTAPLDLLDPDHERLEINATWNRATGEGRVITNMSRRVAAELHTDLCTVAAPAPSTRAFTAHLGVAAYRHGGKA